jgi:hypothetical protein
MEWENDVRKVLAVVLWLSVSLGFLIGVEPSFGSAPPCSVKLPKGVCVQIHEAGLYP